MTKPDQLLVGIARFAVTERENSALAYQAARWCLMDAMGCALLSLNYLACT